MTKPTVNLRLDPERIAAFQRDTATSLSAMTRAANEAGAKLEQVFVDLAKALSKP